MRENDSGLQFTEDLVQICNPLHLLGLTYFNHIKIVKNKYRISLGNHRLWLEHFIEKKYHSKGHFSKNPTALNEKYYLWDNMPDDGVILDAAQNFDIAHGFTIIKKSTDVVEAYIFATNKDNYKINNFYINHLGVLNKFVDYYHDVAENFIKKCKFHQLIDRPTTYPIDNFCIHQDIQKIQEFNSRVDAKKFFIQCHGNELKLSKMQYGLIKLLIMGKSAKEISNILGIQPGSCYKYIDLLKSEFSILTTQKLIEFFAKSDIFHNL